MHFFKDRALSLLRSQSWWLWTLAGLSVLFMMMYGLYTLVTALSQGTNFSGYAADGPFQLYNPLRRLAAGQVIGKDFQFFHGIGVPLLHYPLFKLLGSNLFASEVSRWLVSPLLFLICSLIFFRVVFRSWPKTVIATALLTIISIYCSNIIPPSNSLIIVRTTFPILAAAALLWQSEAFIQVKDLKFYWKHLLAILCLSLAFLCGTEQGAAAIIAYFLIRAFDLWHEPSKKRAIATIGIETGLIGVTIIALMAVITHGHIVAPLRYALIDIPKDQSWYFGAAPNGFMTWGNLWPNFSDRSLFIVYAAIALSGALFYLSARVKVTSLTERRAYIFLWLYGLIVCGTMLGYFSPTLQLIPLLRVSTIIIVSILMSLLFSPELKKFAQRAATRGPRHRTVIRAGVALGIISLVFLLGIQTQKYYVDTRRNNSVRAIFRAALIARHSPDYVVAGPGWKRSLDTFSPYIKPGAVVWSTYSSLYESNANIFNPSRDGFDYIIHALGPDYRQAYLQQFNQEHPQYVITLKPVYFAYEEWLWSKAPQFYEALLSHYTLIKENSSHYLWRYNATSDIQPDTWRAINVTSQMTYALPHNTSKNHIQLIELRVRYKARSLAGLTHYVLTPYDTGLQYPISLPTDESEWTFIVPLLNNQTNPMISASVEGLLTFQTLTIQSLSYKPLITSPENLQPFEDNYCTFPINAKKGIACETPPPIPPEERAKPLAARVPD
jgi:hypothetical protein